MTQLKFNYRATQDYIADGVGETFRGPTAYESDLGYGYVSIAGSGLNRAAGGNPNLSGVHLITSNSVKEKIVVDRGNTNIKMAFGGDGASAGGVIVWDGDAPKLAGTPAVYSNSANYTNNQYVWVPAEDALYQVRDNGAGQTAATGNGPTGTGHTIINGTVAFRFVKKCLFSIALENIPNGSVSNALGEVYTFANWAANNTARVINPQAGFITIVRNFGFNCQLRYIEITSQIPALVDLEFKNNFGEPLSHLYGREVPGKEVAEIIVKTGKPVLSLTGTLASHYVITVKDGISKLYTNPASARLADNASGTLSVVQTDAAASNGPTRATNLISLITVISSGGRNLTEFISEMPTKQYLIHKAAMDASYANRWLGHTDQVFFKTIIVSSSAEWNSLLPTELNPDVSNNTKWFNIRIRPGDWTSNILIPNSKNFGTGGVKVEYDDPSIPVIISGAVNSTAVLNTRTTQGETEQYQTTLGIAYKWHFKKIIFTGNNSTGYIWRQQPGSIPGFNNICLFDDCEFGAGFRPDAGDFDNPNVTKGTTAGGQFPIGFLPFGGKEFQFQNCKFWGLLDVFRVGGVLNTIVDNCKFRACAEDVYALAWANNRDTLDLVQDDTHYVIAINNFYYDAPDNYTGISADPAHKDYMQRRNVSYGFIVGSPSPVMSIGWKARTNVATNSWIVNETVNKVYRCVTGGKTGLSPPSSNSASISDGEVVWKYMYDGPPTGKIVVISMNERVNIGGSSLTSESMAQALYIQRFIDSGGGLGIDLTISEFNCYFGASSPYGIAASEGQFYSSRCTYVGPTKRPSVGTNGSSKMGIEPYSWLVAQLSSTALTGRVSVFRNIMSRPADINDKKDWVGAALFEEKCEYSTFKLNQVAGSIDPNILLKGPYTLTSVATVPAQQQYHMPDIDERSYGWNAEALFEAIMARALPKTSRKTGARYKKTYPMVISASDSSGNTITKNLDHRGVIALP